MATNCTACGAPNELSDGASLSTCVFCGVPLEKNEKINQRGDHLQNPQKVVPEILLTKEKVKPKKGQLSLKNRGISKIDEIVYFLSDEELAQITVLNLSQNKIDSLEGIEKFSNLKKLDLSHNLISDLAGFPKKYGLYELIIKNNNLKSVKGISNTYLKIIDLTENNLTELDDFPDLNIEEDSKEDISINLSKNTNLKKFKEEVMIRLEMYSECQCHIYLNLKNCENFDLMSLFNCFRNNLSEIELEFGQVLPDEFINLGFEDCNNGVWWYDGYAMSVKRDKISYQIKEFALDKFKMWRTKKNL